MSDTNTTPLNDDEYRKALKLVVDDTMRTDVLGERLCVVFNEHKPTDEAIKKIIKTAIEGDPSVKEALEKAVKELDNKRKVKWIDRGISLVVGAVITIAIAWITLQFK